MPEFNLNIVLFQPEIPQNTGSIGRLCVNLNARLHLIKPLGFSLQEKQLRRAGLDYWQHLNVTIHEDWGSFLAEEKPECFLFASTKGKKNYFSWNFVNGAYIVFGRESSGLPPDFYKRYVDDLYQIPMPGENFRSLNLSNSAAVIAYEAYRQWEAAESTNA